MDNNYRKEAVPLIRKGFSSKEDHSDLTDQEQDDLMQSPLEDILEQMQYHPRSVAYKQYYRGVLFCSILWFVLGSVISFFALALYDSSHLFTQATEDQTISFKILNSIGEDNIRNYLRTLTEKIHLAGTPEEKETADYIYKSWKEYNLDTVKLVPYDVMLSYPNKSAPNKISVIDANQTEVFSTEWKRFSHNPENDKVMYPPFTAYSPPTAKPLIANPVYINYGSLDDFLRLKRMGINITSCIAIIRYGKIFRGDQVKLAEKFGAAGVILYSDPADTVSDDPHNVYPSSIYLPPNGVTIGTLLRVDGDPTTPFYPSIKSAYRVPVDDSSVPQIPVHAISYYEAEKIMSGMAGEVVTEWKGKLPLEYKVGPGYINPANKLKMEVHTHNEMKTIYNVIGVIHGKTEPDRYVIIGNHRDAWSFGAVDPSSGTASMLEISRVFGKLLKEGWRPRRSVAFCSWGAEEYGIIGSTEWVEEHQNQLTAQAVAYLNVDIAVEGNFTLRAKASPLLYQAVWDAAKKVTNPNPNEIKNERKTVYDTWVFHNPQNNTDPVVPQIEDLGSGSDYVPFFHQIGVPSLDIVYTCEKGPISCYPLYHTLYETYDLQNKLMDQGFHYHRAITQVWGEVARSLADAVIIPFSIKEYAVMLADSFTSLNKNFGTFFKEHNVSLSCLEESINKFSRAVDNCMKTLKRIDVNNPYEVRRLNDQLMLIERSFIDIKGVPGKPFYRHVIFSPSVMDNYNSCSFTGLVDLLVDATKYGNKTSLETIKEHFSSVVFHISSAGKVLSDDL